MKTQSEKGWVMRLSSLFLNTEKYFADTGVWIFRRCFNMTLPSQFIFFSLEKKWLFPRKTDLCTKKLAKLIYAQRNRSYNETMSCKWGRALPFIVSFLANKTFQKLLGCLLKEASPWNTFFKIYMCIKWNLQEDLLAHSKLGVSPRIICRCFWKYALETSLREILLVPERRLKT